MNITHKVIREGGTILVRVFVDGINCGTVTVCGTSDPKGLPFIDAVMNGTMSLQDLRKRLGFE